MISLTYNGVTAQLSVRLIWADEFDWSPVKQSTEYSTTGVLLVDVAVKQGGRPITLEGKGTAAWITRELCVSLQAWAALPAAEFALVLRGVTHTVLFDHAKGGFDAAPLWKLADGEQTPLQIFIPKFRFIQV